jgi:hypothetical protein
MKFVVEIDLDAIVDQIHDVRLQKEAVAVMLRQVAADFPRSTMQGAVNEVRDPMYLQEMEHTKLGYSVARAQIVDAPFDRSVQLPESEAKSVQHGIDIHVR